ncbi:MAG: HXXEE domain-containing protein [Agriterribacter sp.]
MFTFSILSLLLPVAVMLHVTEEFLFPGGFVQWYQKLVPSKTKGENTGFLVWINTLMMFMCVLPIHFGKIPIGVSIWYCVVVLAAINACFHIWGMMKLKAYSPGVITGVLLYIPLCVTGTQELLLTGAISWLGATIFLAAAIGYHIFSVYRQSK